jgi:hypothetical protein
MIDTSAGYHHGPRPSRTHGERNRLGRISLKEPDVTLGAAGQELDPAQCKIASVGGKTSVNMPGRSEELVSASQAHWKGQCLAIFWGTSPYPTP